MDGFKLDRRKLTTVQVLGSGNFGQVCKAIYGPLRTEVAVKSLKGMLITIFTGWKMFQMSLIDRNSSVSFNPILLSNIAVYVLLSESVIDMMKVLVSFLL